MTHKDIVNILVANGVRYEDAVDDAYIVLNNLSTCKNVKPSLTIKDIYELGNAATILQLQAMKLQVRHNEGSPTADIDKSFSVVLMRLKKSIDQIRDFYTKEH